MAEPLEPTALRVGQTFQIIPGDATFGEYVWTVIESRPDDKPDQWRVVVRREWEFGQHTMTTFWPAP